MELFFSLLEYYELSKEEKSIIIKELIEQPNYYLKDDILFVHAGIVPDIPLEQQDESDLMWVRSEFLSKPHNQPYIVIFGHTPTPYLNEDK